MKNRIMDVVMPILPRNGLSHWVGRLAHKKIPGPLGQASVAWFAKRYAIDLSEAEHPLESYESIGALFSRRLRPGVRPIGKGIVHPADGRLSECGVIENQRCIQAKGKDYGIAELLGDAESAKIFEGGTYMTYYLCPTDYHRVHAPVDGRLTWLTHSPGDMWPVNEWSVNAIFDLFPTNERVSVGIETEEGRVALVMVAATNVGNMTMTFDSEIRTNSRLLRQASGSGQDVPSPRSRKSTAKFYDPAIGIRKGDEIGVFNMGSTVVMLYEKGMVPRGVFEALRGRPVRMGESLQRPLQECVQGAVQGSFQGL